MKAGTEAIFHELISGMCGWIWILAILAAVTTAVWALFGELSWWWFIGFIAAGCFFKAVTREYMTARDQALFDDYLEKK